MALQEWMNSKCMMESVISSCVIVYVETISVITNDGRNIVVRMHSYFETII